MGYSAIGTKEGGFPIWGRREGVRIVGESSSARVRPELFFLGLQRYHQRDLLAKKTSWMGSEVKPTRSDCVSNFRANRTYKGKSLEN